MVPRHRLLHPPKEDRIGIGAALQDVRLRRGPEHGRRRLRRDLLRPGAVLEHREDPLPLVPIRFREDLIGDELFTLIRDTWGVNNAEWNSVGTRIVIGCDDGSARIYFARIDDLIELACTRTGRNMTYEEWQRYMGSDALYRLTCPNLPARGW